MERDSAPKQGVWDVLRTSTEVSLQLWGSPRLGQLDVSLRGAEQDGQDWALLGTHTREWWLQPRERGVRALVCLLASNRSYLGNLGFLVEVA